MGSRLLHVALFLMGLVGGAATISSIDRIEFDSLRARPLELTYGREPFDTAFLGSSRVRRAFIPQQFDEDMRTLGIECRSFNIGIGGLRPHDYTVVVNWLLRHRPPHLRRLLIEAGNWHQIIYQERWLTDAEIQLSTPAPFVDRLVTSRQCEPDIGSWLEATGWTATHTLLNAFSIGRGPRILSDLIHFGWGTRPEWTQQARDRGFEPITPETAPPERASKFPQWQKKRAQADRMLKGKVANEKRAKAPGFRTDLMVDMARRLQDAGIEVTFVLMPRWSTMPGRADVANLPEDLRPIDLDDVEQNKALYNFDFWFDSHHIMPPGAELLTRRLAELLHERTLSPHNTQSRNK